MKNNFYIYFVFLYFIIIIGCQEPIATTTTTIITNKNEVGIWKYNKSDNHGDIITLNSDYTYKSETWDKTLKNYIENKSGTYSYNYNQKILTIYNNKLRENGIYSTLQTGDRDYQYNYSNAVFDKNKSIITNGFVGGNLLTLKGEWESKIERYSKGSLTLNTVWIINVNISDTFTYSTIIYDYIRNTKSTITWTSEYSLDTTNKKITIFNYGILGEYGIWGYEIINGILSLSSYSDGAYTKE